MGIFDKLFGKKGKDSEEKDVGMWKNKTERSIQVLLRSKDNEERSRVAIAIGRTLEIGAIPPLTKALKQDKVKYVRAICASFLGLIGQLNGNTEAIQSVIVASKDKDAYVRKAVAETLYIIEDQNAHETLQELAKDPNDEVRNMATRMLGLKKQKDHGQCPFLDAHGVCIGWLFSGDAVQECSWEINKEGLDYKDCAIYPSFKPYESSALILMKKDVGIEKGEVKMHKSTEEMVITTPIRLEMVRVPAGEFLMGSDPAKDKDAMDHEQPRHLVYLPEFYISKYPVTNVQYEAFVSVFAKESWPVTAPRHWEGGGNIDGKVPPGYQNHPVVNVYYNDVVRFCEWLRRETGKPFRLPTEVEWEKAARGTDGRIFPWGNEWDKSKLNSKEAGLGGTTQVGSYPEGASPYGALDISGNVWAMCSSLMKPYPYKADNGREDLTSTREVIFRGGSFDFDRKHARCAYRETGYTDFCLDSAGFRVVVSMSKSTL